ncbi:MAG TPA: UvrD-helicase domain-containing protein [Rectinema sp.]|mgnify:FL=1|nr:UvrD-helicase domain-containing protein [Rectinema sp.]
MILGQIPEYLEGLNPEQLEAVCYEGNRLLILAGAGTGKTRVITTKIAHLVKQSRFLPESILAVTFTNKAANEMRERAMAIEPSCERAIIRTFHSFGAWFMRRNANAFDLRSEFTIYDEDDSAELVHSIFPAFTKRDCGDYAFLIAKAKDYCLSPDSPNLDFISRHPEFRRIYSAYEDRLRSTGNVDFGDLILMPALLLEKDETIRNRTRQRFRVILVDEYQDSNIAQFRLLQQLAGPDSMLCVVGDDDQSIYRFRGAEVKNILNFPKVFADTRIIRLERNYRSHQAILDLAHSIVVHNENRLGKNLLATRPGGNKPKIAFLDDQDQEIEFCAHIARQHVKNEGEWKDIAILYRTNAQSLGFERLFPQFDIPYRIVGAVRFYEREEIKDMLAFLAILANPRDEISFKRVVNKPSRGIGASSLDKIISFAFHNGLDLIEASRQLIASISRKGSEGLKEFLSLIEEAKASLHRDLADQKNPGDLGSLISDFAQKSGLLEFYASKDRISSTHKKENIEELVNAASDHPLSSEGLLEFLDDVMLDQSRQKNQDNADAVTLITMHNTKGLEFPIVIVTGLEQGLFPRNDEEGDDIEEQRRLFYVSVTRAKNQLYLTSCRWRRIHGKLFETMPSQFLSEIDPSLYKMWGDSRNKMRAVPSQYRSSSTVAVSSQSDTSTKRSEWTAGMSVYHDEYGNGTVIKVTPSQSAGPLVIVQFETGKTAQFFPKYTKKLERIKN